MLDTIFVSSFHIRCFCRWARTVLREQSRKFKLANYRHCWRIGGVFAGVCVYGTQQWLILVLPLKAKIAESACIWPCAFLLTAVRALAPWYFSPANVRTFRNPVSESGKIFTNLRCDSRSLLGFQISFNLILSIATHSNFFSGTRYHFSHFCDLVLHRRKKYTLSSGRR